MVRDLIPGFNHPVYSFFPLSTSHLLLQNIWNPHFSIKKKVNKSICFSPGFLHPSCLLQFQSSKTANVVHDHNYKCAQCLGMQFVKSGGLNLMKYPDAFLPTFFLILDLNSTLKIAYHSESSLPAKSRRDMVHT